MTTFNTLGFTFLSMSFVLLGGCAEEPDSSSSEHAATAPSSSTQASRAEYAVSCHGDVSLLSIGGASGLGTRCVGGEANEFCGDDPCAPQAIAIRYVAPAARCPSTDVYAWDGAACKAYPTQTEDGAMRCSGDGCAKLFKTVAECNDAHVACAAR